MKKVMEKTKWILVLEDNIKKGNQTALEEFWKKIHDEGAPIIEDISDEPDKCLVTFLYEASEGEENILIIPEIGDCCTLEYTMDQLLDTNLWYVTCEIRNDLRLEYSISVNDPLDDDWDGRFEKLVHDKLNKQYLHIEGDPGEEDEILSYVVMPQAEVFTWTKEKENIPKGTVQEYMFSSDRLEEDRRLRVYLPHGYSTGHKKYKYLVLNDGDEYLQILHVKHTLDNLIHEQVIEPIVVLFIDSTDDREEELSCNDTFVEIIIEEIIPWFRASYHITHEANDAIIGGLSLGGLTAAYIGLHHGDTFGMVLSQSGAFWYNPEEEESDKKACWLADEYAKAEKHSHKFYFDVGILEEVEEMIGTNQKLCEVLRSKGNDVLYYEYAGGHDYLCWGETLATGLKFLLN